MEKIVLFGDSIRIGYDKYVKMALEGQAEVYYPKENCRFTQYMLRYLHEWIRESGFGEETDLIHWNAGLWDVAQMFDDEPNTPIDIYERYIDRICRRIRLLCPKAKVVFATSTPIDQEAYEESRHRFWRSNETIQRYNEAAVRVVTRYGFVVNDLYALLENAPKQFFSDKTHYYTREATEVITGRVLDVIREQTGLQGKTLDYSKFFGASCEDVGM